MLNPLRGGFYSVQLLSHKVMRYAAPVFLAACLASSTALAPRSVFYLLLFAGQAAFYAAALVSWALQSVGVHNRLLALPQYFVLANLASVMGFYKFARGERYASWEPIREPAAGAGANEAAPLSTP